MLTYVKKASLFLLILLTVAGTANAQITDYLKKFLNELNSATYIKQDIPTTLQPGERRNVIITVRNTGLRTWDTDENYALLINPEELLMDRINAATWGLNSVSLPYRVTSGEDVTFNVPIVAPSIPGKYNFRWRMAQNFEQFGDEVPATTINVSNSPVYGTTNSSMFVNQTVPDYMNYGDRYRVIITMRNNGINTWMPYNSMSAYGDYKLVAVEDSRSSYTDWGVSPLYLESPVEPGHDATFSFDVTAPQTPAVYNFQWQMMQGNTPFGERTQAVQVQVGGRRFPGDPAGTNSSSIGNISLPSSMKTNAKYTVSITITNTGQSTWTRGNYRLAMVPTNMSITGRIWDQQYVDLPNNVDPGETVVLTFKIKAPSEPGTYAMQWQMNENGNYFGDVTPYREVSVSKTYNRN